MHFAGYSQCVFRTTVCAIIAIESPIIAATLYVTTDYAYSTMSVIGTVLIFAFRPLHSDRVRDWGDFKDKDRGLWNWAWGRDIGEVTVCGGWDCAHRHTLRESKLGV